MLKKPGGAKAPNALFIWEQRRDTCKNNTVTSTKRCKVMDNSYFLGGTETGNAPREEQVEIVRISLYAGTMHPTGQKTWAKNMGTQIVHRLYTDRTQIVHTIEQNETGGTHLRFNAMVIVLSNATRRFCSCLTLARSRFVSFVIATI